MNQDEGQMTAKQAFDLQDQDCDGIISVIELQDLLNKVLGLEIFEEECLNLINEVSPDGKGTLNYQQFETLLDSIQKDQPQTEAVAISPEKQPENPIEEEENNVEQEDIPEQKELIEKTEPLEEKKEEKKEEIKEIGNSISQVCEITAELELLSQNLESALTTFKKTSETVKESREQKSCLDYVMGKKSYSPTKPPEYVEREISKNYVEYKHSPPGRIERRKYPEREEPVEQVEEQDIDNVMLKPQFWAREDPSLKKYQQDNEQHFDYPSSKYNVPQTKAPYTYGYSGNPSYERSKQFFK